MKLLRYSSTFLDREKSELAKLSRRTRKELNINGGLYTRAGIVRLYLSRKGGGRGSISVEDCVEFA